MYIHADWYYKLGGCLQGENLGGNPTPSQDLVYATLVVA
jgi:hypothetical protein